MSDTKSNPKTEVISQPSSSAADVSMPEQIKAPRALGLAGLITGEEDTMEIHTNHTAQLFNGSLDMDVTFSIPGARLAASRVRRVFVASWGDNPYADEVLLQFESMVERIRSTIAATEKSIKYKLDERAMRGAPWTLVQHRNPVKLSLGFKSPYGFMLSNLLIDFDYMARLIFTAERRDLITQKELRVLFASAKREFRRAFVFLIRASNAFMDERIIGLCRADFLHTAPEVAKKRVIAAEEVFGKIVKLSDEVLRLQKEPRHSSRSYAASKKDIDLFRQALEAGLAAADKPAAPISTKGLI